MITFNYTYLHTYAWQMSIIVHSGNWIACIIPAWVSHGYPPNGLVGYTPKSY